MKPAWFLRSVLNSYSQVFFSTHRVFALLILAVTFFDPYTGLFGLLAVMVTTLSAAWIGFDREKIRLGYYGFNALLVGLGLGVYYNPGLPLLIIIVLAAVLTLFISVALEGVVGKYALPYLSLPFVFALWAVTIATREFTFLNISERGIYLINDLYNVGGERLVNAYRWWAGLPFPVSLKIYFSSLSTIFFQYSTLTGLLLAVGLLIYSRIAFSLSLLGFYTAYFFYGVIGVQFSEAAYSFIGFNYILTAIAIGGFFIVPGRFSYLWVLLLIPITTIITISCSVMLGILYLPVYSLPFNLITLLFLYVLKFRVHPEFKLHPVVVQEFSPEKNLYSHLNYSARFGKVQPFPLSLPFFGEWFVSQGADGKYTHTGEWRHAWDFEIRDAELKTYRGSGNVPDDYYCYGKNILAPADGMIEEVFDNIPDNPVGEKNLKKNWGNTVIIKHADFLYTQLSHLKEGSIVVKPGQRIKRGEVLGKCGNSGNSPYPHLHFQVQQTPFLGSGTLDYPIRNYFLSTQGKVTLTTHSSPQEGEAVASVPCHELLARALHFVPGEKFEFTFPDEPGRAEHWEVKINAYLNKYIECAETGAKAWFHADDTLLTFTHFEGKRNGLLYHFFLAAYTACLGHANALRIADQYPLNSVYKPAALIFQDLLAPFVRFMEARFFMNYPEKLDPLSDHLIELKSKTIVRTFGREKIKFEHTVLIGSDGLMSITVAGGSKKYRAECTGK